MQYVQITERLLLNRVKCSPLVNYNLIIQQPYRIHNKVGHEVLFHMKLQIPVVQLTSQISFYKGILSSDLWVPSR